MLEKLYKKGYLCYERLILDHLKALGLNAEEAVVLIKILDDYFKTDAISTKRLQEQILMTSNKVDKTVASLMERGFYEVFLTYDNGIGKECITVKPLFEKLEYILNDKVSLDSYDIEKTNQYISAKIKRVLTSSELEILQSLMMDEHYSYEHIVEAVDMLSNSKKVISMRSLTQALANKKTEVEPKKEAPAALKDFYNRI